MNSSQQVIQALFAAADALDPIHCIVGGSLLHAEDFGEEDETRKALLLGPDPFLFANHGDRVLVHLNLGYKHRVHGLKTWSVKEAKGKQTVIGHVFAIVLADATFTVRPAGNRLVQEKGEKTVHAWVDGKIVASEPPGSVSGRPGVEVKYNPHLGHVSFVRQDNAGGWTVPVVRAKKVTMTADWKVFAEGVE